MPRSYQRSIRLDDKLKQPIETLPYGTLNTLINQLVTLFFEDKEVREKVVLADSRFKDWEPMKLVPAYAPLPGQASIEEVIEEKAPDKPEILDDFLPGL